MVWDVAILIPNALLSWWAIFIKVQINGANQSWTWISQSGS
jgi:hypothetical protein